MEERNKSLITKKLLPKSINDGESEISKNDY